MSGDHPSTTWRDWSCSVRVTVTQADRLEQAAEIVRSVMADVERAVSRFHPSDLDRVHARSGLLVPVSPLAFDLVALAVAARDETDGDVDPALGSDLVGLGYDADIAKVRERRTATRLVGPNGAPPRPSRRVVLDPALRRVGVAPGATLDLGATAKAWAADTAAARIHRTLGTAA
ncbi:MAG: FAD:protein FMN transferase, partial [Nocardioides sp.]|uniref:FAD:protein FMN transferase n=1 Tax=Nocardioides sp. TaxID=35761 RepID=UPI0039E3A83B